MLFGKEEEATTMFKVYGRCPVLLNKKVAVVRAKDKEEAKQKALETMGKSAFIDQVEVYDGEAQD